MIEPTMKKLTLEILDNLSIEEIIYAEYALPDAMENAGGVIIYIIMDDAINCYEENIRTNADVYKMAVDILEKNKMPSCFNKINKDGIFKCYSIGSGGNKIYINRDVSLKFASSSSFFYTKNDRNYLIKCSSRQVFERIEYAIRKDYRRQVKMSHDSVK